MGENIYMLPSDMNLKIRSGTVRYNNRILISDGKFNLGKNDKVNAPPYSGVQPPGGTEAPGPAMKSQKYSKTNSSQGLAHAPNISHNQEPLQTITPWPHNEEKIALVLALASGFAIWNMF